MPNLPLKRGLLAGLALLLLGAGPVSAHTALTGSDPAEGASLSVAPTSITLKFNENVGNSPQVAVTSPDGTALKVTDVSAVDQQVTAKVEQIGQRGTFALSFRVVSADGHPVTDTIRYDVTTGTAVKQVAVKDDPTFLHRHRGHLFWGILAAALAIALLLSPLRKRHDTDHP